VVLMKSRRRAKSIVGVHHPNKVQVLSMMKLLIKEEE